MASQASGNVTSSNGGLILTFTDSGNYGTVTSRVLNIYDPNGVLLQTYNMGANLTQNYPVTADQYLSFVLTVIDNTGTFTATVNYLAEGIYIAAYLKRITALGCNCDCHSRILCNLIAGERFLSAAERFALSGLGVAANSNIQAANVYVNLP